MPKPVKIILPAILIGVAVYFIFIREVEHTQSADGSLQVYGNVVIRNVHLGFRVAGRLEDMQVEEGDAVTAGQELAHLDAEPYQRQLATAQAQVDAAQAALQRLQNGFRPEEIEQAQAKLAQSNASNQRAQSDLIRLRELADKQVITAQSLDQAVAAARETSASVRLAEANLQLLQSGSRSEDIAAAQAQLKAAESELNRIQLQVTDTTLLAPSDGIVLVRAVEPGTMLAAGQTAYSLSLTDRSWVRAYIDQPHLGDIHPGMRAEVYTDARPDEAYTGHIGFIASQAEFTPKNVETEEVRSDLVFRFRIVVDNPDEGLRQGMPVTVRLLP